MTDSLAAAEKLLAPKITAHDKHRFEVKMDVSIHPGARSVYRVETYFFIPRTLTVNPSTYTKRDFYNNIQRYIRFKTPQFGLDKVRDSAVTTSPLVRLKGKLEAIHAGNSDPAVTESAYNEIKLLGCVIRAGLRDQVAFFLSEIRGTPDDKASAEVKIGVLKDQVDAFLKAVWGFIEDVRGLRTSLTVPTVPEKLREAFSFMDEFFSICLTDSLTSLLAAIREKQGLRDTLPAIEAALADLIKGQEFYRASMNYPSVVDKATDSEKLVYRRGVLKKFVSSVLYLRIQTSEYERWTQVLLSIAAGAAMAFALVIMRWAQVRWSTDSLAFGVVAVTAYMGKDRLKDFLKLWFVKRWTRFFSDRSTDILDPNTQQVIGRLREAVSFVRPGNVPPEILRRRVMDNITAIENDGKPEDVLRYEKEVALYPDLIAATHERRKDLNDILRVNIQPFLAQADDPKVDYDHLNPKTGRLETLQCTRVYHINVLIRYVTRDEAGAETDKFDRIRIVVTRKGIKRLEEVPV